MRTEQCLWRPSDGWLRTAPGSLPDAQLALVFAAPEAIHDGRALREIRDAFPQALVMGCSTAGEIFDERVHDDSLSVLAVEFEHSHVQGHCLSISKTAESFAAGAALAERLDSQGLVHVFVLSDGLRVNGSELVKGMTSCLPEHVAVTGGLAGDGSRFEQTLVFADGDPSPGTIAVLGLYGDRLRVGYGSLGGWDPFGPERVITRSEGSVLYELDGRDALTLYKHYLGEHAEGLPGTGLLFPLSIRGDDRQTPVVRTLLAVDENDRSLRFAGDVPTGHRARLMMANFDRLVDGAIGAASDCATALAGDVAQLAILISCVGRKLVLEQRVEEEVEGVREVLGPTTSLAGFYSYGEISPLVSTGRCELHNQTMTITTISEVQT